MRRLIAAMKTSVDTQVEGREGYADDAPDTSLPMTARLPAPDDVKWARFIAQNLALCLVR